MTENDKASACHSDNKPFRIRLPGFIRDEEIGLGDVVKRATYAASFTQRLLHL